MLVYKDGIIVDKYREVKNTLVVSCNKEMTREKSVRKKARYKREREIYLTSAVAARLLDYIFLVARSGLGRACVL